MKIIPIVLFIHFAFLVASQELDKLSKKELKVMYVEQQKEHDSLLNLIYNLRLENKKRDSLIKDLNEFTKQLEQKLNKLEFETTSCAISRDSLKINLMNKEKEILGLNDSLKKSIQTNTPNIPLIECTFKEEKIPDCEYPVTLKSCNFGIFKNIITGTPGFEGNYTYSNDLFKKVNGKYIPIKNTELFNAQKMELLTMINAEIKQNFEKFLKETGASECFENASAPFFNFNDLLIDFGRDKIDFIIKYSEAFLCFSEKNTIISFSLKTIAPYLNK